MPPNLTNQKNEISRDETTQGQPNFSGEALTPSLPTHIENITAEEVREFEEFFEGYVDRRRAQENLSTNQTFATPPALLPAAPPDISRARLSERNPSTEQDFAINHPLYINLGSSPDTQIHPHPSPAMHFQSPIHHQQQQPQSSHQQGVPVARINTHHLSPPFRSTVHQQQSHSPSNYRSSPHRPQNSQPTTANSSWERNSQKRHSRKEEKNKPGRPREHYPPEKAINSVIKNDRTNIYRSLSPKTRTKKAKERLANNYAVNRSRQKKYVIGQEVLEIISGLMEPNNSAHQRFVMWNGKNGKNIIETLRDLLPKEPNTSKGKGRSKKRPAEVEEAEDEDTEDEENGEEIYEEGADSHDDNDHQPQPPPSSSTICSY